MTEAHDKWSNLTAKYHAWSLLRCKCGHTNLRGLVLKKNMKITLVLLVNLLTVIISPFAFGQSTQEERILSSIAVSQIGRFQINYSSSLVLDEQTSIHFETYREPNTKKQIEIGAIPGDEDLNTICNHPVILKEEKIADINNVQESDINYFNNSIYKGCVINLSKNKSAIIIEIPNSFVNQSGEKIKHIGVVADSEDVNQLKASISFQVSAKDFFINLVQISQVNSSFSKEINWDKITSEGIEFIGDAADTCSGLVAAQKFLIPALRKLDLHSLIIEVNSENQQCALPSITDDSNEDEWKKLMSTSEENQQRIRDYMRDFHGDELGNNISYLYIPGILAFSSNAVNERIQSGRSELAKANVVNSCGLIVDLRFGTGGNYIPMVLTIGGLLSSGELFNIDKTQDVYLSKNGNKLVGTAGDFNWEHEYYGPASLKDSPIPIAILTDWMTGSSSNITSIAIHDSAIQARVFGMKTSPTTSANQTFSLLDGNTFNVMVSRIYSKHGDLLPLTLPVDEMIADDYLTIFDRNRDLTIKAAKEWLESLSYCRREAEVG